MTDNPGRGWPALGVALPLVILFIVVLSIPLASAQAIGLSPKETGGWILVLWGLPGLLSLALTLRYRQPLLITGNLFAIIFIASLGDQLSYPELIGAFIVTGAIVLLVSASGISSRLRGWIPTSIVLGLLAGAVIPFVAEIFTSLGKEPAIVGGTFLAYLAGRRWLGTRIPAVLPALIVGVVLASLTGQVEQAPVRLSLPIPALTPPVFSFESIATVTPVLFALIMVQSNLPSLVFMQSQGYQPPDRTINLVSGVGTIFGSFLGPVAVSLSLPATSLVAGTEAGDHRTRHHAVYLAGFALVVIALLSGIALDLTAIIPLPLLLALAGLAMVGVLANALQEVTRGPLILGPIFALAIALSDISLLGFGPFFWALVLGIGISLLLERDQILQLREEPAG